MIFALFLGCLLELSQGPCASINIRFYYNNLTSTCQEFTYGGCNGNENNFKELAECEHFCTKP